MSDCGDADKLLEAIAAIEALLTEEERANLDMYEKITRLQKTLLIGLTHARNEDEVKEYLQRASQFLFMLWKQFTESQGIEIAKWVAKVGFLDYVTQLLLFCRSRTDTYAELLKDRIFVLISLFTHEDVEGQFCS